MGKSHLNPWASCLIITPLASGFRISGGLTAGGYNFDASTASIEFDGTTYTSDFDLNIKQDKNIIPVIALGYTRPVGQSE